MSTIYLNSLHIQYDVKCKAFDLSKSYIEKYNNMLNCMTLLPLTNYKNRCPSKINFDL